jgi:hypothetical protein
MELERCRSCNAAIRWVTTEKGKGHPLNPDPDAGGNVVFVGPTEQGAVHFMTKDEMAAPTSRPRYTSHFATCPQARTWSRGVTPAARARTQERFDQETRDREEPKA